MPTWFIDVVDTIFSFGFFLNAFLFISQAIKLLKTKDSSEVSLLTFGGFNFIQLFALLYGVIHHDTLLIVGYILSIITCGFVTFLIIYYRICKKTNLKLDQC